jgi:hypothetical protein
MLGFLHILTGKNPFYCVNSFKSIRQKCRVDCELVAFVLSYICVVTLKSVLVGISRR